METRANYILFRERFIRYGCFNVNHILCWNPEFDRNSLTRWVRKGYLVRLRQGWYAFRECLRQPDMARYIANRIYSPSYISLETALSFYGMIPEAVTDITSVTTLKTSSFMNEFGRYSYRNIKTSLFFGFDLKPMTDSRTVQMATPEKALIDLMYLTPQYNGEGDMMNLRLDEAFMCEDFNKELSDSYIDKVGSKALKNRMETLYKAYGL